MAYAILKGLNRQAFAATYCNDINPARTALFEAEFEATAGALGECIDAADMIILAVKPQQLVQVMEDSRDRWTADKLFDFGFGRSQDRDPGKGHRRQNRGYSGYAQYPMPDRPGDFGSLCGQTGHTGTNAGRTGHLCPAG